MKMLYDLLLRITSCAQPLSRNTSALLGLVFISADVFFAPIIMSNSHLALALLAGMIRVAPPVVFLAIGHGHEHLGAVFFAHECSSFFDAVIDVLNVINDLHCNVWCFGLSGLLDFKNRSTGRWLAFAAGAALELTQQIAQAAVLDDALGQVIARLAAKHGRVAVAACAWHVRVSQKLARGLVSGNVVEDVLLVHNVIIEAFSGGATGSDECVKVNVTQASFVTISLYTVACGNPCFSSDVLAQDASVCIAGIVDAEVLIQVTPGDVIHMRILAAFSGGATVPYSQRRDHASICS